MKKTLKILSVLCAIVLIIGTISVGMSAYAASDDVIGDYDFEITNVYKDIDWSNVTAYKGETHVHTVRSDADTEVDDMIHKYYELGFDVMALTDHGTINYGWDHDQGRVAIFDYQFFVHGAVDNLKEDDYKNIITGARSRSINSGKGMMEIPLGIELNGMSTIKCHVNGFYADADHGGLGMTENWPTNAVVKNYNKGGFTHINHVGEWSGGNDDTDVYTASWVRDFANIYENYCPNRGGRNVDAQTNWMSSHKGEAGCIGMELVNTADSRTHNDRRLVYDEILKILAPQGINVFGFCEDDAHEYSDCDRNAQYFLINNNKDVEITSAEFDKSNNNSGQTSDYTNNNSDPIDQVQNYYRDAMFYGEFYASSKNSKNSYELGNGFNAVGNYPSVSNISVDKDKNQISVSFRDATMIRMVADGEVVESFRTNAGQNTVVFDLNRNENKINSYVRIYLTGAGGITYLQPFLVKKVTAQKSTVQFITQSNDVNIEVKDSNGSVVPDSCKYENYYYILPAGNYSYTASRRGYISKTDTFTVTAADIEAHTQKKITVGELEEVSDVDFAYFYTPETIYVKPSDNKTFDYYIDRDNNITGALHADPQKQGNIFFTREGASNITLEYTSVEGATNVKSMTIGSTSAAGDTLSTSITGGELYDALQNNQFVYIKWVLRYTYKNLPYEAISYTYVYKPKTDQTSVVAAGGDSLTKKAVDWFHSTMNLQATVYVAGIHKLVSKQGNAYKYSPYNDNNLKTTFESNPKSTGTGYCWVESTSRGSGSGTAVSMNSDAAYIYADRSRINNWSQIPYFMVGLDINTSEQCTGENGSNAYVRLGFDATYSDLQTYDPSYHYLYDLEFSSKSSYTLKANYNLDNPTDNASVLAPTGTCGSSLSSIDARRLYQADNEIENKKLIKALPSKQTQEAVVPVSACLMGSKEHRTDTVQLEVNITLVNTDKSGLRYEFNNTVKGGFQADWFQDINEWYDYQNTIAAAGKVLGNPCAEIDEINEAKQALIDAVDGFHLKTGTLTVGFYWKIGNQTGLIYNEPVKTYVYGEDLSASAKEIAGYEYNRTYDFFCEDVLVYSYANGEKVYAEGGITELTDNDNFDLVFAEKGSYEWRFYYTPNTYNVTYDSNGADPISNYTATALYGQSYTVSSDVPQRTGYEFNGWYLDAKQKDYSSGATFKWDYAGDGEFKAKWNSMSYNITYDVNGGNTFSVEEKYKTAKYGETYSISPDIPVRLGYSFIGWELNNDGKQHTPGSNVSWEIAADSTFVAQWEIADYTVTFNKMIEDSEEAAKVTLSSDSITVRYDEPYGTLPTVTRAGYTCEWYSDPNYPSNKRVTAETKVKIPINHELFAKWIPDNYTITYNLNGGSVGLDNPSKYTVETESFVLNEPVRTGYDFIGWSGTGITGNEISHTVAKGTTGNLTFTANWELRGYKISYDLNDKDGVGISAINDVNNPLTYKVTDSVTLNEPTRAGFRFTGWTGSNGTTAQRNVTIPAGSTTGNKSYTANWEPIDYSITYNYGGATVIPSTNPRIYNVKTPSFTLTEPERTGYDFAGWTSNNENLNGDTVTIVKGSVTGDLTFKAVWKEANAFEITYILHGGRVDGVNPETYKTGETPEIYNPLKDGYVFKNWEKTINGETTPQSTATIGEFDSGDIIFEAFWRALPYSIVYNLDSESDYDGGRIVSDVQNPQTYSPDDADITLANPIKPGYTFTGYTGTGLNRATQVVVIPSGSYGDRSYRANWSLNNYTITYDFNGGADTGLLKSYTANTTTTTIGAPVRPGYVFAGWSIDFERFTWTAGSVNSNGKFVAQTGSYYSDPVSLQSGMTYSIDSSVSGLRLCVYSSNGATFIGSKTGNYTAESDCIAFIVADNQQAEDLRTVKLNISGTPAEYDIYYGSIGNMQFTANWQRNEYAITYNLNDGSFGVDSEGNLNPDPNPASYTYDSSDILLVNPTKTGYTFLGWEYNGIVSTSTVIKNHSTGDRTYTAIWEKANYTITYTLNGGVVSGTNPGSYAVDSANITLNNPAREGYTFEGWVGTGLSAASKNVVIPSGSIGNRQYIATWTPVSYSISYILSGGTNSSSNPAAYTIETPTFSLSAPTRAGAVFTGWQGTGIEGTSPSVTVTKGSTGNREYTATWSITTYTISYDLAGGSESTNPTEYTTESSTIRLAQPAKTGYTFEGWTGTGLSSKTLVVEIPTGSVGHRNYTANWKKIDYTITYYLNGGEVAENANPKTYDIETASFELVNPVKAGYRFTGWTGTDLESETIIVTIDKGTIGNRSYTATWAEDGYSITYENVNYDNITFEGTNPSSYTVISPSFKLYNPARTGYNFKGWSGTGITGSGISTEVTIPTGSTGNRKYTANWELATYKITYELNGGSLGSFVNPEEYTYFSGDITLYNPVNTGLKFEGWESDYYDGVEKNVTIQSGSTGDKTFIAKWGESSYTITLDPAEGVLPSDQEASFTYKYSDDTFTIKNPEREGFSFGGWTGTGITGTVMELTIEQHSTGDREYTATWISSPNALTYNLQGGVIAKGSNPDSYVTGSGTLTLINPVKEGYKFNGWTNDDNHNPSIVSTNALNKAARIDTSTGGSINFTATWSEAIPYNITYNLNGGQTATANPATYTVESTFTLNNPTRDGYVFDGWSGTDLGSSQYKTVTVSNKTGSRTYTANWKEQPYTITYNYNGGYSHEGNPSEFTVLTPSFTLNNPERAGYTFAGWTGTGISAPKTIVTIMSGSTGNREYTANWTTEVYSITYEGLEGATYTPPCNTYTAETPTFSLGTASKLGYEFLGWTSVDSVNPVSVEIRQGSSGDRTYTAQWRMINYSITYILNDGMVDGTNPATYNIDSPRIVLINPTKPGSSFTGWSENGSSNTQKPGIIATGSTGNKVFTAVWGEAEYTISLNTNGGELPSGQSDLITYSYSDPAFTIQNPIKTGYRFIGWTGTDLEAATTALVIPTHSSGNKAYKANWGLDQYTITVDYAGGTSDKEVPATYTYESDKIVLPTPKKSGYVFEGWSGTGITGTASTVTISNHSAGNRVYTAVWSDKVDDGKHRVYFYGYKNYPIRFDADGRNYIEVKIGEPITEEMEPRIFNLNDNSKPANEKLNETVGYRITGWDIDFNSYSNMNNPDDIEVHGKWEVVDIPNGERQEKYSVIVNGSTTYSESCNQYEKFTATTDAYSGGSKFCYWTATDKDVNGNEVTVVVSYYLNYTFFVHDDITLTAVYGEPTNTRAITRVSLVEDYDPNYDWFTIYAERNIATENSLIQHGVIFTTDQAVADSIGTKNDNFVIGTDGVFNAVSSDKGLTGMWTVSIINPYKFGSDNTIYIRSYVIVANSQGKVLEPIYSNYSKAYVNNQDPQA